ncbi:MAG: ribosomal RNA small subunit methyltransferase A [Spirochaetaceae bacterium]|nr:MAG: ribosomal RNA small subunit methyltransferase A [Spirochaetaceae bacterium]
MNYDSPKEIRKLLESHGLALKKRWGQNFLINRSARLRIADLIGSSASDTVWEIGPGLGAMTTLLLERAGRVIAFEIDYGMIRALLSLLGSAQNLVVRDGDAITRFADTVAEFGKPGSILGNLPYSSASKIISTIIEQGIKPRVMIFTVQKELAQRICARPGSKNYSSFSVFCQAYFDIKGSGDLSGGSFYPEPEVVSTVISMIPCKDAPDGEYAGIFTKILRSGFSSRRKMLLRNLLAGAAVDDSLKERLCAFFRENSISEKARAEELDVATWTRLARFCAGDPAFKAEIKGENI